MNDKLIGKFIRDLSLKKEVLGICLLGSYSKKTFDEYSDIDIALLFNELPRNNYVPPFSFYININDKLIEFNVSQLILEQEEKSDWDFLKMEAYSSAIILYEIDNVFSDLIKQKLNNPIKIKHQVISNLNQVYWRLIKHAKTTQVRGYNISSSLLKIESYFLLIDTLFLINDRFKPHTKWIEKEIQTLKLYPPSIDFSKILLTVVNEKAILEINDSVLILIYEWLCNEVKIKYNISSDEFYSFWVKNISGRQIVSEPFSEIIISKLQTDFDKNELEIIKGQIAFNLCSSQSEIIECIDNFCISEKLKERLKKQFS